MEHFLWSKAGVLSCVVFIGGRQSEVLAPERRVTG